MRVFLSAAVWPVGYLFIDCFYCCRVYLLQVLPAGTPVSAMRVANLREFIRKLLAKGKLESVHQFEYVRLCLASVCMLADISLIQNLMSLPIDLR